MDLDEHSSGRADDRLRLIFACCDPALEFEAQITLALRMLCGLTTAEIARAFLVSEATIARRLMRAKQKIAAARIPYRLPSAQLSPERISAVLGVIYLLFNEGYTATAGSALIRSELCNQAIRLASMVVELMPDDPEARGLLALLLLQHARSAARTDASGALVPMEEQDRSRWDFSMVDTAVAILRRGVRRDRIGPYQLQAWIAACHASAPTAAETDWAKLAALYEELARLTPSPVVELNRAVAMAMADGPAAGLVLVDALESSGELAGYHLLPAVRADLLRRLGRVAEAADQYRLALAGAQNAGERAYLTRRLAECRI